MTTLAPASSLTLNLADQPLLIRRAAVLGAGTMGSRIAAHLANAGIPVLLLDMVPEGNAAKSAGEASEVKTAELPRSKLAIAGLEALAKSKPAAFYDPAYATRITPGNFDDDLPKLADCDWVIEAVAENLAIKHALLGRVAPHLGPNALLTTNTSGLPIHQVASALPEPVRKRFFGTHFFNPPRYMQLLEIIPAPETDPALLSAFAAFGDRLLGKQIVLANDTPNFIGNRIGVSVMFTASTLMLQQGLTIEEADVLTGQAIGWPRTGTFRLADMVGIDILAHVAANFPAGVDQNRSLNHNAPGGQSPRNDNAPGGQSPRDMQEATAHDFSRAVDAEKNDGALAPAGDFSALLQEIVKRNWLGDKTGQGFYKKIKSPDGPGGEKKDERLVLDLKTLEYRPTIKPSLPSVDMAKNAATLKERLRMLMANDPAKDKAARFLWPLLATLWNFAADRIGDASNDAVSIDRAMRAGFNWELGPFEMWDAAGVRETVARMKAMNLPISPAVESLLDTAQGSAPVSWYSPDGPQCYNPVTGAYEPIPQQPGHARVSDVRRTHKVVRANTGASLVDMGDGIGCIELHSLKNAIGGDVVALVTSVLKADSDAVRDFTGFVITSDREHFSVGANLMQLLLAAQEGDWDEVEGAIRQFQQMTAAIKFCPRPVVVAPFGMTFGGGAEMCLLAARRQPYAETYIGLVEAGVGLIPGGGGTKEMLLRAVDAATAVAPPDPKDPPSRFAQSAELQTAVKRALETIAMAKVSTSAAEARILGLLGPSDRITLNRERLLLDAKAQVQSLIEAGYAAPVPRTQIPAPGLGVLATLETGIYMMGEAGFASEHDQKVAKWVAYILSGGRVTAGSLVSEQYLLDLEREAFLSLCGERKTQERIAHTLKTGKPLRN
jgi:3-hydroxyacyl-CoA dehydrogenase